MDVWATEGEEEEGHVPIRAHAPVLGRVPGRVLDHAPGLHGTAGNTILMSLRGTVDTVGGEEVGLELAEGAEGEVDVVGIVKSLGLVLHLAEVAGPHAGGRQATNVEDTEGAGRGRPRTLCVPAGHGRDLTLVPVPVLHVLGRGRAPCPTLLIRGTAGVGVARVLDQRVVEGEVIAKTTSETAVVGLGHQGSSCLYFFSSSTSSVLYDPPPGQYSLSTVLSVRDTFARCVKL